MKLRKYLLPTDDNESGGFISLNCKKGIVRMWMWLANASILESAFKILGWQEVYNHTFLTTAVGVSNLLDSWPWSSQGAFRLKFCSVLQVLLRGVTAESARILLCEIEKMGVNIISKTFVHTVLLQLSTIQILLLENKLIYLLRIIWVCFNGLLLFLVSSSKTTHHMKNWTARERLRMSWNYLDHNSDHIFLSNK